MDGSTTPDVQKHAGCNPMEHMAQQDIHIVPEPTLKSIAKGPLVQFTATCEDQRKVARVWQCLLETYSTASLNHTHTAAICNALSSFLDEARASKVESTRQLAFASNTWLSVFNVHLSRYKDAKPRPMKQVFESLVGLLLRNPDQEAVESIKASIVDATIPSIVVGEPRSRLKASLIALEILLRKSALSPVKLIPMVEEWLVKNRETWSHIYQIDCNALSVNLSVLLDRTPKDGASSDESHKATAEILTLGLLTQAKTLELVSCCGSMMGAFFLKVKEVVDKRHSPPSYMKDVVSSWVRPVRHMLLQNPSLLEEMATYILNPLFSIDGYGFKCFLNTLSFQTLVSGEMSDVSLADFTLLFASLQMAKKSGLVHEDHYFSKSGDREQEGKGAIVLKSEIIGQYLLHEDMGIRIAAFSLLVTAPLSTKPLSSATTRAVLRGLPSLHAETDSYSRGEILSLTRHFINRLKGGILKEKDGMVVEEQLSKNNKPLSVFIRDDSETEACMKEFIGLLKSNLRPTASYPRHIAALKNYMLLIESGCDARTIISAGKKDGCQIRWRCHIDIFDHELMRLLVDLLIDPYDEVRAVALNILQWFPRDVLLNCQHVGGEKPAFLDALARAEQLASNTSRADHADTVARLFQLLFSAADHHTKVAEGEWWQTKSTIVNVLLNKLEEKVSIQGGLFKSSLRDAPLHGYVAALKYIVATPNFHMLVSDEHREKWRLTHNRIVAITDRIWEEVKPVLCIDSPEGHTDEPVEDLNVGPKDILSYSWRALRESSLLLHATIANKTYGPNDVSGLNYDDYQKVGASSFTQLAELRHRGAFSTVAQTFAMCCLRCSQTKDKSISNLPQEWYEDGKRLIFEASSKLTRRSAGLPALITGILTSQPGGPLFTRVMEELHEISHIPAAHDKNDQNIALPQVHAMNCLKDIFINNKLGPFTEPFIMPALTLSAERLGSPIWALRNCGLMLFRSLLTRMCRTGSGVGFGGSSGSEPGARVSFQKHPGLIELLASLLTRKPIESNSTDEDKSIVTERVFPAMELIAEKIPNVQAVDDNMLRGLIHEQLKNPVWGIREHAARVYASLLDRPQILKSIRVFVDDDTDNQEQDYLHGKSLCIKYSLRRFAAGPVTLWNDNVDEITSTVLHVFAVIFPFAESPFVANTLLEILSDAVGSGIRLGWQEKMAALLNEALSTYNLTEVLDYILDSSHPSWKALSSTRACSLLRRTLSWLTILRMFIVSDFTDLEGFFHKVSHFDSDASRWVLEQMQDVFGQSGDCRKPLLTHYPSVILGDHPQEVKSTAIACLASELEVLFRVHSDQSPEIDLAWEPLDKQMKSDATEHTHNRDRSDADLRLQACLLAGQLILNRSHHLESNIRQWSTRLRFALQEDTEFTTRYAAVLSITSFAGVLRPSGSSVRTDSVFLDIYLSLYDMLNDDDEEIRDLAACTASWILSSPHSSVKSVALSPLNASERLSELIADKYTDSRPLNIRIIKYITGKQPRIGDIVPRTTMVPVADTLAELRKESTVLFEQEKQNLFIDEVREVDLWSSRLHSLSESSFDERSTKELCKWVSDGVSCLVKVMSEESGRDGLIGWASKNEAFTLGVRVISIAAIFASRDFPASKYIGEEQKTLERNLKALLHQGEMCDLHNNWLVRIRKAVDCCS